MFRKTIFTISLLLSLTSNGVLAQDGADKLPLPRFVSVASDEVNVRTGPGVRYPIKWVLTRNEMPVEIIAEFEDWRKIRDVQNDEGWAHKAMLRGRRTALIKGNKKPILNNPYDQPKQIAVGNNGALVRLRSCDGSYCEMETPQVEGYIKMENIWGVYEGEKFKK